MGAMGVNGRCNEFVEFRGTKRLSEVLTLAANLGNGSFGDDGLHFSVIGAPMTNALFRMSATICKKQKESEINC